MAGIGFELRRVIGKGGLSRSVGAALSGMFIVAGPWLMTILAFFFISAAGAFQVAVIYAYAFSICLFSALHHHFTRLVADLIWENRHAEASAWLLRVLAFVVAASALIGAAAVAALPLRFGGGEILYRMACVVLFVAVNAMWVVMLYVSLLRRYGAILGVFAAGLTVSVLLVKLWGEGNPGGALFGYAVGHAFTAAALVALSLGRYPSAPGKADFRLFFAYGRRYVFLILSGAFFYAGQWADKFFFWISRGEAVAGTPFRLFPAYDVPVFAAGLSIVPGLVYFIVYSETEVYASIRRFLGSLTHETLGRIKAAKARLRTDLRRELRDQSLFQLAVSSVALVVVFATVRDEAARTVYVAALAGAFVQYTLMTLLNFLYYFELYAESMAAALVFLVLNAVAVPLAHTLLPFLPPGVGFFGAGSIAVIAAYRLLLSAVPDMDRRIFLRTVRRNKEG